MRYDSIPGKIRRKVFDVKMRLWDKQEDKVVNATYAFADRLDDVSIQEMEDSWDKLAVMILRQNLPFGALNYLFKADDLEHLEDCLYNAREEWTSDLVSGVAFLQSELYHYGDRWSIQSLIKCNTLFVSLVEMAKEI